MNILLNAITDAAKKKELTIDQVVSSFNKGSEVQYQVSKQTHNVNNFDLVASKAPKIENQNINTLGHNKFNPIAIVGGIGTFIAAIGTAILIGNNWDSMSVNQQLLSSLGIGLVLFYISYFLSTKYKDNVISNIMIVLSGLWFCWGLLYSVDKTVGDKSGKIITMGALLLVLTIVYTIFYKQLGKSLYYLALSATGLGAFMFITNYFVINADGEKFGKIIDLGLIVASLSGLCLLAYNYSSLSYWVRDLTLLGEYIVFNISTYIYIVILDKSWANGSERIAEIVFGLVFVIWYWIAIKYQNRVLLVINSIAVYYYLTVLATKYFENSNFAYTLILGGLGLIAISGLTYYVSQNMQKKRI